MSSERGSEGWVQSCIPDAGEGGRGGASRRQRRRTAQGQRHRGVEGRLGTGGGPLEPRSSEQRNDKVGFIL